MTSLTYDELDL